MLKAVFFDLDGTLLRISESDFTKVYFTKLCEHAYALGIMPDVMKKILFTSLEKMYKNDGSKTNEEVFWDTFYSFVSKEEYNDKTVFDDFYDKGYLELEKYVQKTPISKQIVDFCKENQIISVLSTNPFFPKRGQINRVKFAGMDISDFAFVTDYSNSRYSKPNPMYFKVLLDKFNLSPEEVIIIGNNEVEDGVCGTSLGIKTYLVDGYLIKDKNQIHNFDVVTLDQVIDTIKKEIEIRR